MQLYANSYALVIGNDQYSGGWPRLSKAVSDARKVAAALEGKGFEVTLKTDLDGGDLQAAFEDFFILKGRDPDARLFVWYAGHGDTMDGEGYLIPVNGVLQRDTINYLRRSVSLREFGRFVRLAKSKHIYTVFDSCFAGTIFNVARSAPPPAITRVTSKPVRQFLSSGDAGQTVSDGGTFATLFIEGISGERRSDLNGDGYITGSEMGAFLTDRVSNYTNNKQVPRQGKLNDPKYDTGDFVFLASLTTPPAVQQAVVPAAPRSSGFNFDDINNAATKQQQVHQAWSDTLTEMQAAYEQILTLDQELGVTAALKLSAWERFSKAFAEDNPYSTEDNTLRAEASLRIQVQEQAAGNTTQISSKKSISTTASGLQYETLVAGTGIAPTQDSHVKVHYEGRLVNGHIFDSSIARGTPMGFGLGQVIPGWTEGLQLMRAGGKTRFTIPSDLAYGPSGRGEIPPNSVLIFEVELLEVK